MLHKVTEYLKSSALQIHFAIQDINLNIAGVTLGKPIQLINTKITYTHGLSLSESGMCSLPLQYLFFFFLHIPQHFNWLTDAGHPPKNDKETSFHSDSFVHTLWEVILNSKAALQSIQFLASPVQNKKIWTQKIQILDVWNMVTTKCQHFSCQILLCRCLLTSLTWLNRSFYKNIFPFSSELFFPLFKGKCVTEII